MTLSESLLLQSIRSSTYTNATNQEWLHARETGVVTSKTIPVSILPTVRGPTWFMRIPTKPNIPMQVCTKDAKMIPPAI